MKVPLLKKQSQLSAAAAVAAAQNDVMQFDTEWRGGIRPPVNCCRAERRSGDDDDDCGGGGGGKGQDGSSQSKRQFIQQSAIRRSLAQLFSLLSRRSNSRNRDGRLQNNELVEYVRCFACSRSRRRQRRGTNRR